MTIVRTRTHWYSREYRAPQRTFGALLDRLKGQVLFERPFGALHSEALAPFELVALQTVALSGGLPGAHSWRHSTMRLALLHSWF